MSYIYRLFILSFVFYILLISDKMMEVLLVLKNGIIVKEYDSEIFSCYFFFVEWEFSVIIIIFCEKREKKLWRLYWFLKMVVFWECFNVKFWIFLVCFVGCS